tara:strand:- start:6 stop:809 length:804 start_codon:yes stop_codon:yes gene_type:complete
VANALHNQYLQTLGVVQYVPRDLPLVSIVAQTVVATEAASSADSLIDFDAASETISASVSTSVNIQVSSAPESLEAMTKSMAELSNLNNKVKPGIKAAEPKQEPEAPSSIAVKFALWQPTDDLLICSSVEGSLPDPEQILLLGNILLAMGQGAGQLPQMDIVEWPPYPNARGDSDEVREFLATLIKARIDSKSAKTLLLMGDAAAEWLLTSDEKAATANGQVSIFGQITALLVPSLREMIEQPSSKRKTWQTIRFLSPQRHVHKAQP